MTFTPAPKPSPTEKASKPLQRKAWGVSQKKRTPMKKSGTTKAKKVERQKAFYASATWRRLKKEAKERAGNRCEYIERLIHPLATDETGRCLANWYCSTLHVHHLTNARFGGDELPEDLQVLCTYHHRLVELRDHPTRHPRRGRST